MRHADQDGRYITIFDSVEEITETALAVASKHRGRRGAWESWNPRATIAREHFVGREFESWREVADAANAVWPAGLAIAENMVAELAGETLPAPISRRRAPAWREDDGDEICLDRLRAGQAYWRGSTRQRRTGPSALTIVVDLATCATVDHEEVLWRGVAAIVLANQLEEAGYLVEIWLASHTNNCHLNGLGALTACLLKGAGDPLDIASLVNAVSGWFYRTIVFGSHSVAKSPPGVSMGHVARVGRARLAEFLPEPEEAVVVSQVWDRRAAMAWIRQQLARFAEHAAPTAQTV